MASPVPETAMTPDQALRTVATVRGYRERLTGRAAGVVWMVWGFALALLASSDMLALSADEPSGTEGWSVRLDGAAVSTMVVALGALLGGILATNAVWRAHALERGERHRAWVTWLAVAALVAVGGAVGFSIVEVLSRGVQADDADLQYVIIMPLVGAIAAAILTVLQRRRVQPWPGIVAAVALLALQFAVPLVIDMADEGDLVVAIQASVFGILLAFVATGLWYHRRG